MVLRSACASAVEVEKGLFSRGLCEIWLCEALANDVEMCAARAECNMAVHLRECTHSTQVASAMTIKGEHLAMLSVRSFAIGGVLIMKAKTGLGKNRKANMKKMNRVLAAAAVAGVLAISSTLALADDNIAASPKV